MTLKDYRKIVYQTGGHGAKVSVAERQARGKKSYQLSIWNPVKKKLVQKSLGHHDLKKAKSEARRMAVDLERELIDFEQRKVTLEVVLANYLENKTAKRTGYLDSCTSWDAQRTKQSQCPVAGREQSFADLVCECSNEDHRRAELFIRVFGRDFDPSTLDAAKWAPYQADRRDGVIDGRGRRVKPSQRKPLTSRALQKDLMFLKAAFKLATFTKNGSSELMVKSPIPGGKDCPFNPPEKHQPVQVAASRERIQAVREVAGQVKSMELQGGKWVRATSQFSEFFDVICETGRRLSAVRQLRRSDLRLEEIPGKAPYGAIVWPSETDKMGLQRVSPMSPACRDAIDRVLARRPLIGGAYLFPSPKDSSVPIRKERLREWLKRAEALAGLEPHPRTLWHAYRRSYVTRKTEEGFSDAAIAMAAGYKDANTMKACYQVMGGQAILDVVLGGS